MRDRGATRNGAPDFAEFILGRTESAARGSFRARLLCVASRQRRGCAHLQYDHFTIPLVDNYVFIDGPNCMRIAELRIENFRGIRQAHIKFSPHTVFVGGNGCGKTTIIEALALLFGRDRMVRSLTEHDFYGSDPAPADRINFVATIIDFEKDDPAEHPEWFREDRGVPKWWDPLTGRLSATRDTATWRLACQVGFCARFDRPSLEVETIRYFHDDDNIADVFTEESTTPLPSRLIRDLGFFLVPANRTWDRVVSFGSELFRRVVSSGDGQPADSVLVERNRLRAPQQPLEQDPKLSPIVEQLNEELARFFPNAPSLQLRITSTDSDGLLDAVVPHYRHTNDSPTIPARRHGNGLISLQHLLLLLQFGRRRAAAKEEFWMALEEPELHIPPPLQRSLINRIQSLSTQTFVSTHSPMLAAFADPQALIILRNKNGTLSTKQLLDNALPSSTPNSVRKLFQINRLQTIEALMHDALLVPEGRIDYELVTLLTRILDLRQDWSPAGDCHFGSEVGVIPTHDAAIEATIAELAKIHPQIVALVDGDKEGLNYSHALAKAAAPPSVILRWPASWTFEDTIGWILDGDSSGAVALLRQSISPAPQTVADLVSRLKSTNRTTHGLKQDQIAYETIASVIGSLASCRARALSLLNAVADIALGRPNSLFAPAGTQELLVRVFKP